MWEIRRGLRPLGLYVGAIVTMLALLGVLVAPKRMLAAWRASGDTNLFVLDPPYDDLLDFTVKDLRDLLGLPHDGVVPVDVAMPAPAAIG